MTDGEYSQREHNQGQEDGSKAGFLEKLGHSFERGFMSDDYNTGFDNGAANPKGKDDEN